MRRWIVVCVALGVLALVGWEAGPWAQTQEVKVGAIYPLSGQVAKSGEDTLNGIRLAVEIVNGKYDLPLPLAKDLTSETAMTPAVHLQPMPAQLKFVCCRHLLELGFNVASQQVLRSPASDAKQVMVVATVAQLIM